MGIVIKPNTFADSTPALASEVNANFDTLYTVVNGNLESANLASGAVTENKLAAGAVAEAKIAAGAVTDAKVSGTAAISLSKLAALTAGIVPVTDAGGVLVSSLVTDTELGHLAGVTSAVQAQIDGKLANTAAAVRGLGFFDSTNDGAGSGLDADLLDGQSGSFYQNASNLSAGTVPTARFGSSTVPVTSLKKGTGSFYNGQSGDKIIPVNRYAFASPTQTGASGIYQVNAIGYINTSAVATKPYRGWDVSGFSETTWDYLTASGFPRLWAEVDNRGDIHSMWESEDPADEEFPDEPPIEATNGLTLVRLELPDERILSSILAELDTTALPNWHPLSRFKDIRHPHGLVHEVSRFSFQKRGLEFPEDIRDVYSAVGDYEKRYWQVQLWLRAMSRVSRGHRNNTLIDLYRHTFRVNSSGKLEFK